MKYLIVTISVCLIFCFPSEAQTIITKAQTVWNPDNGDGTYKNPVINADYSDPDVIRVGDDYYLVSSSFAHFPGLPILHSTDLVNWTIIGHAAEKYPIDSFSRVQHGNGIWAPSIRFHNGEYFIYFGDPDNGVFVTKANNPAGPWSPLHLIKKVRGWIDTCPFWDEDGNAYLVHAWANSRSGIKSILTLNKMSQDGMSVLDEGIMVFDGRKHHPTMEGPKMYKRNGFYYIFAPAGGVKPGWQTVLRSKNIYGPYEDKVVLEQGSTKINGPHQGAWVETPNGESWFLHFQDRNAYGRVVHLQPMNWNEDWPVMGQDFDHNGIGEPVSVFRKPWTAHKTPVCSPQTNDEFDSSSLGLQWQWNSNFKDNWFSLSARKGWLRLYPLAVAAGSKNLWRAPNLLLQKFPATEFRSECRIDPVHLKEGEMAGLIVFGLDYSYAAIKKSHGKLQIIQSKCLNAEAGKPEMLAAAKPIAGKIVILRIDVSEDAKCSFSYSWNGKTFFALGEEFMARPGKWVGAKVGLFYNSASEAGFADVDWFRFTKR